MLSGMSRARQPRNPLQASRPWQQGTAPAPEPAEWAEPDVAQGLMDPLARRAVRLVRNAYGIEPGDFQRWTERHDRLALKLLQKMRLGEPLPERFR